VPEHKTIRDYLDTVEEQIRWKRARPVVLRELEQHLNDQRDAFWDEEHSLREAERLAVEEMGDPVSVGTELDRIHRPKPQWALLVWTVALAMAGGVLRIWLTAGWDELYLRIDPVRTLLAVALGCVCLVAAYLLDYTSLLRHARWVYLGALAVCAVSLKFSPNINNVSYYTRILAFLLPVVYAVWLYSCRNKGRKGFFLAVMGGMPLALICMLAPSIPALFILLVTGLALLLFVIRSGWLGEEGKTGMMVMTAVIVLTAMGACAHAVMEGYFHTRLMMLFHPEQDPLGFGYQALMLRKALHASVWWGQGNWPAGEPYPFEVAVPNCETDCFLTTVIFRLGWGPFLLLVAAFAGLMGWMLLRRLRQKSRAGKMVVLSVVLPLCLQALFSVVLNLGFVLFSTQMPLVVGNVQTVVSMALVGLALSVFRGDAVCRDPRAEGKQPHGKRHLRIRLVYEWV